MTAPNAAVSDFDLKALLDLVKVDTMLSTNCHAIGTIQSFDETKQTAQVSINYKRITYGAPETEPVLTDYPLLLDCPVVVVTGGTGGITFPIAVGDTCLVFFNDRDIDNWHTSGQVMPPASLRIHSFSDAIALVGIRSLKNPISGYSASKAVFFLGTTKISLGSKIKAQNAATDLLTALTMLTTLLDTFLTATSAATIEPTLGPAAAAAKVALALYKTTLEGLLE